MKKIFALITVALGIAGISFTVKNHSDQKPWPVPDNFKNMKNPIASDAASIADGKALWALVELGREWGGILGLG